MSRTSRNLIIVGAIFAGIVVVSIFITMALDSAIDGREDGLLAEHAALCTSGARKAIHRKAGNVTGFVLRYPNFRQTRVSRTPEGRRMTTRRRMSSRPCPGRCLVALMRGGYSFVENQEYASKSGPLVSYRYLIRPKDHPRCIATPAALPFDPEIGEAAAALARRGDQCLARVPIVGLSARYEVDRQFRLERLGIGGAILRITTKVRERKSGAVLARQDTFRAFPTNRTLSGGRPAECPGDVGRLLRPSEVLIAPGHSARNRAAK